MPLTALVALTCLRAAPQQAVKEEVTVKGFRLYARCWRTPTGEDPYLIWTIGSRDAAPAGEEWVIRGESVSFEGLPIQPVAGFVKDVAVGDPDKVAGAMMQQAGGEKAQFAIIRGRLEKVATLVESLPLGDPTLAKALHQPKGGFGPMHHFQIDKPIKLTTPSGLTIEVPAQGPGTSMRYGGLGAEPMAALTFRPSFKESEDKIPGSPLWQRLGGAIEVRAQLKGIGDDYSYGFAGKDYVVEAKGFAIKPGPAKGVRIEITQIIVLQSYALDFRVPVKDSK
ncbi:MAG: hypothetical protein ACHQ50_06830 [Fimbriimonadales bacterium]